MARSITLPFLCFLQLLMVHTGCASFRSGEVTTSPWPPEGSERATVNVIVRGNIAGELQMAFRESVVAAYRDSNLFTSVTNSPRRGAALTAEVQVTHRAEANQVLAFISGFTFLMIPARAVDRFSVTTTFRDDAGNVRARTTGQQDVTWWAHLLLLPVTPFAQSDRVLAAAYYDLARDSLVDAAREGAF